MARPGGGTPRLRCVIRELKGDFGKLKMRTFFLENMPRFCACFRVCYNGVDLFALKTHGTPLKVPMAFTFLYVSACRPKLARPGNFSTPSDVATLIILCWFSCAFSIGVEIHFLAACHGEVGESSAVPCRNAEPSGEADGFTSVVVHCYRIFASVP